MRLRIIIIDDEECVRESLAMYLSDLGHEVLTAESPDDCPVYVACECDFEQPCADLLMIDQNMQHVKGLDFIKAQQRRGCKMPTTSRIVMTGSVTPELSEEAVAVGCGMIQKPFRFTDVDAFLEGVTGARGADED